MSIVQNFIQAENKLTSRIEYIMNVLRDHKEAEHVFLYNREFYFDSKLSLLTEACTDSDVFLKLSVGEDFQKIYVFSFPVHIFDNGSDDDIFQIWKSYNEAYKNTNSKKDIEELSLLMSENATLMNMLFNEIKSNPTSGINDVIAWLKSTEFVREYMQKAKVGTQFI